MPEDIDLVDDITEEHAEEYFSSLAARGVSERTYNAYLQALKLIFKIILDSEKTPFAKINKKIEQQQSREAFTLKQLDDIFRLLNSESYYMLNKAEMRGMLTMCLSIGCRGEDACLMKWNNFNPSKREISYTPLKTARKNPTPVTVPVNNMLHEALENALNWRNDSGYIFPAVAERYKRNPDGIYQDVIKLLESAGIETSVEADKNVKRLRRISKFSLHSFRHTFVTISANNKIPLHVLQDIVGHSSPMMTKHYTHTAMNLKKEAVNIFDAQNSIGKERPVFTKNSLQKKTKEELIDIIIKMQQFQ